MSEYVDPPDDPLPAPVDLTPAPVVEEEEGTDLDSPIDKDETPLPEAFTHDCGFLTGIAGSGKTFLAKMLAATRPEWTMAASTGIAAVNLGEATTIHSLLGYFDEDSLRAAVVEGWVQTKLRTLHDSGLERILLDEVSMISGESLTLIQMAIDEVNSQLPSHKVKIGLTVIGDFCQLPPVAEKIAPGSRKNKPVQFAFEAQVWERYAQHVTKLTENKRQADLDFIEGLNAIRRGDIPTLLAYFAPRCQTIIEQDYPGLTIFSKNASVDRWNDLAHRRLATPLHKFQVHRDGKQKAEWLRFIGDSKAAQPEDDALKLREGALVMVLANKIARGGSVIYANGDLGTFEGEELRRMVTFDSFGHPEEHRVNHAMVRLQRTGRLTAIAPVTRQNRMPTGATGAKKDRYEVVGWIEYIPLRLAWASTVHKVQGLSMDHVQVAFADPFFTSPAMLYVAFSRARSAEGLRIVGTPQLLAERCNTDGRVRQWL